MPADNGTNLFGATNDLELTKLLLDQIAGLETFEKKNNFFAFSGWKVLADVFIVPKTPLLVKFGMSP